MRSNGHIRRIFNNTNSFFDFVYGKILKIIFVFAFFHFFRTGNLSIFAATKPIIIMETRFFTQFKNGLVASVMTIAGIFSMPISAQSEGSPQPIGGITPKPSIAIVDFDVRGYKMSQQQAIQFVINELIRVEKFEVMDKYDIE